MRFAPHDSGRAERQRWRGFSCKALYGNISQNPTIGTGYTVIRPLVLQICKSDTATVRHVLLFYDNLLTWRTFITSLWLMISLLQ